MDLILWKANSTVVVDQVSLNTPWISPEEQKIRDDLETEIERYMEEEIKDGICDLALRLHSLYQQQKNRDNQVNKDTYTEVNVKINSEGACKIKINKYKCKTNAAKHGTAIIKKKQFDWPRARKTSSGSGSTINKNKKTQKLKLEWKY